MTPTPQANRPHYSDGSPVPDQVDSSTQEYSRGVNPTTGAKGAEPAEPRASLTSIAPTTGAAAGGTAITLTGDNFGGSTGVTIGGVAATAVVVVSETQMTCVSPAGAGVDPVVVQNPAGNSTEVVNFTYV